MIPKTTTISLVLSLNHNNNQLENNHNTNISNKLWKSRLTLLDSTKNILKIGDQFIGRQLKHILKKVDVMCSVNTKLIKNMNGDFKC